MSPKKSTTTFPLPSAKPEEVGMSSKWLSQIRPRLQKYIDNRKVPNLVTLVARRGKLVHYEAQGYLDLDSKAPAGKDAIYRLWSDSKPIAGVATMMCVEDGLLKLDDPVSRFVPSFKNPVIIAPPSRPTPPGTPFGTIPTFPAQREITVRDCLRNTTGMLTPRRAPVQYLTDFPEAARLGLWSGGMGSHPIREVVEAQGRIPLASEPGTEFEYNVGYLPLTLVLESATGKTLEEFYQERIFKPLQMNDTSFYLPKAKLGQFPACYRPRREEDNWKLVLMDRAADSEKVKGPKTYFGAGGDKGGVLSTAADYVRFAQMLMNGGELDGVRIMARKSVEIMTMSHTADDLYPTGSGLGFASGPGFGFGMGVGVYKGGGGPHLRSVGTYGWTGLAGTIFFNDPKEELIGICFTQVLNHRTMPDNNYQEEFEQIVYQSLI